MPLRAPLAAVLFLLFVAAPSAAMTCSSTAFEPASLKGSCGGPISQELSKRCETYVNSTLASCRVLLMNALVERMRLERKPPSPEHDAELEKKVAEVARIERSFESLEASARAAANNDLTDLDAPNPYVTDAFAFFRLQLEAEIPPASLANAEKGAALFYARRTVAKDEDESKPRTDPKKGLQTGTVSKDDAVRIGAVAEKLYPDKPARPVPRDHLALAGDLFLTAGRPGDAERPAKALVETAPKDSRGPAMLAEIALSRGDAVDAARWAERALALDPANKRAKDALSFARSQLSAARLKGPGAVGFGEKSSEGRQGPGIARATTTSAPPSVAYTPKPALAPALRRAYEKFRIGDLVEALTELTIHLDANSGDAEARTVRAEVLLRLGKPEQALADCERVLTDRPDDARALRAKAAALWDLGHDAEALTAIERALLLEAGSGAGHLIRAKILERLGRAVEALAEYENAARLDPANEPVAEAAALRLGRSAGAPRAVARNALRGGFAAIAAALILLGLIGGAVVATRRRTTGATAAAAKERTLKPGDLIAGQYRITRELGRGGMGVVFEAVDEQLKRTVALKQLQGDYRSSAEDAARFLQEARLVAQLRHPNVAGIHAAVEDGGLFLVFELVRGRSLDSLLGAGVSPEQARGIVTAVCAALTAAHARRIVHRDLKPSNLMISDDGEVKVMDFGIAHQSRGDGTLTQTAASGTPPYMAPEQAMGSVSSSSDLYALAVMAYELLCGTRPFDGPDYLGPKMRGDFPRVTSRRGALPPTLDAFFASALSPDPAKRPRDAKAFAEAFTSCWP